MNEIDYVASAYQRIKRVVKRAERDGIDLACEYPKQSKGWRLQVDLDHIGGDLNCGFCGISTESKYRVFDRCLQKLEGILKEGYFFNKMEQRRKFIKERYEKSSRIKRISELLGNPFLR